MTALRWQSVDEKTNITYNVGDTLDHKLFETYDVCLTGPALAKFDPEAHKSLIFDLLSHTWVYARVSPAQKVTQLFPPLITGIHPQLPQGSRLHNSHVR